MSLIARRLSDCTHEGETATPTSIPTRQFVILYFCVFCDIFADSSLAPYIYFMIRRFDLIKNEAETAFYLGLLSTLYFAARCLSNTLWGWLSDRVGRRKPFLLSGILGCTVGFLFFGFSETFIWVRTMTMSN